jgi:hypothetical protein
MGLGLSAICAAAGVISGAAATAGAQVLQPTAGPGVFGNPYAFFALGGRHSWEVYRKMNGTAVVTAASVAGNNTLAEFTNQFLGDAPPEGFNFTGEVFLGTSQAVTPPTDVLYLRDMTLNNGATTPPSQNYDANLHTSFDLRIGFLQSGAAYMAAKGGDNHDTDLFGENRGTNGVYVHLGGGNTGATTAGQPGNVWNIQPNGSGAGYLFGPSSASENLLGPTTITRTLINSGTDASDNGSAYDAPLEVSAKLVPDPNAPGNVLLQAKAGNNLYQLSFDPNDPTFAGAFDWQHATPVVFVGKGAFDSFNPASAHLGILAAGDANADGTTDFSDLVALAQHYNNAGDLTWSMGDFTGDGLVDFNDLVTLAQNYNRTFGALPLDSQSAALAPEPASLWMAAAFVACARTLSRRHRRRGRSGRRPLRRPYDRCGMAVLAAAWGSGLGVSAARAAPVPAFAFAGATAEQFGGGFTSVGYQFTTSSPLSIGALGVFDHGANDIPATGWDVGIYMTDASRTLLTSATVKSSDASTTPAGGGSDVFRYHDLPAPFLLPPGTYTLASMDPSGWFVKNATGLTTGAGLGTITIDHATYSGLGMGGQPLAYPENVFDTNLPGNFGPNLLASGVPEPEALLIGASTAPLLARRRHRRPGGVRVAR